MKAAAPDAPPVKYLALKRARNGSASSSASSCEQQPRSNLHPKPGGSRSPHKTRRWMGSRGGLSQQVLKLLDSIWQSFQV